MCLETIHRDFKTYNITAPNTDNMGKLFVMVFAGDYTPAGEKPQVIYQPEPFFLFDLLLSFRSRLAQVTFLIVVAPGHAPLQAI
jgi:hypothetical protein